MSPQCHPRLARIALGVLLGAALLAVGGCRTPLPPASYDYFAAPASTDPWSRKIRGWQLRERADVGGTPAVASEPRRGERASEGELRHKFQLFRDAQKRQVARDLAAWIQLQAGEHYRPDGPVDHWATLEETFRSNGDDCDGLELLVFHLLRELGFADEEVYRAIVFRPSDGQHHMVTLWFEDPTDPWVIDPTGAMTGGMPRMSEVPGWEPLKVFSDDREFTVRNAPVHTATR